MLTNSFAIGKVWHKRYTPKVHEFSYKLNSWLVDIDNFESLDRISLLVSSKRFNLYSFDPSNYLRDYPGNIATKIRLKFANFGIAINGEEKIFMLGQLKNCGLYFSPLNLYFYFLNNDCQYVLAEVSNTPWNERHYYLINNKEKKYIVAKNFHVSPFWQIEQDYHWHFEIFKESISFRIDNYQNNEKVFSAGYKVSLVPFADRKFNNKIILRQPFTVLKILMAIYFEAFKIFLKGIPYISYQKQRRH